MQKKEHEQAEGQPTPRIAEATGSAPGSATPNISARAVEDVMAAAVKQCAAEGVTEPAEIKKRMLDARDRLKAGK